MATRRPLVLVSGELKELPSGDTMLSALFGATTVGDGLLKLPNPGALSFLRINADNTISALAAADFRSAIGAGTSLFDGAFSSLSGRPTTLSGYGITDAQGLDADLTALAGLSANGLIARTGAGTATTRTITGTANQVIVTNGDGVSGNPTLSLPQSIATTSTPQFSRIGVGVAADATTPLTIYTPIGTNDVLSMVSGGASGPSSSANFRLAVDDGAGMSSGDRLGAIFFGGNDSSTQFNAALISAFSMNDWTPGSRSSRMDFSTTDSANNRAVRFSILDTGLVRLHSYGAGTLVTDSSGNVTASSDRRLKNVSGKFTRGLAAIMEIQPKVFTWKPESGMNTDDVNVGFIAQDVQPVIPEAVGSMKTSDVEEDDGTGKKVKKSKREASEFLTLSDRPIIAALVNAVKELSEQNAALVKRITALEMAKK